MWRSGIFGPSLSGKTTLARALVKEYERKYKMRAIVLDLNNERWADKSVVLTNDETFWDTIWKSRRCLVVVEESSETIKRNPDLIGVFTRLRHQEHKLIVIGHSGMSLLPVMREQIDTLYLFKQTQRSASQWVEDFVDERLLTSTSLQQFEFIRAEKFKTPQKMKLKL